MRRPISEVLCKNRLSRRIDRELDELATHVGLWCALEDRPAFGCPQMLGPDDLDWGAVFNGGLRATGPPNCDVFFDSIELFEGSVEIERIELLTWNSVGQESLLDGVERMLVDRAATRNFIYVKEICPGLGRLLAFALIGVGAVGEDDCKHIIPDKILGLVLGRRCINIRSFDVEFLEITRAFVAQLIGGRKRYQTHVPGISLGIDHALDEACWLMLTL